MQVRERGVAHCEALMEACPIRLRPILMTSIAPIVGALPPALAIGPGAEVQRPMALALVGGMAVSTLLTLFVVPAGYSVLYDALQWRARHQKAKSPVGAPEPVPVDSTRPSGQRRRLPMTLCPIALAVGCQKCPAFRICPLTTVLGDVPKTAEAPAPKVARTPKPKAKGRAGRRPNRRR